MQLYLAYAESVARHKDLTALVWEGGEWTYGKLFGLANIVGHELEKRYSDPSQKLALLCPNTPNFFPALLGTLGAGHVTVPFNPLLNPEELALLIEHSDAPALLYDPLMEEKVQAVKAVMQKEIDWIAIPDLYAANSDTSNLQPEDHDTQLAMILYTSGTTGNPKGVMLSHKNVHSNQQGFVEIIDFGPDDTFPCVLPLFHTFAMTVIVFGAMLCGGKVVLFPQFAPQKVLEVFVKEKNNIFIAVPPMLHLLARLAPPEIAQTHQLRFCVSGGGPLPADVAHAFKAKFDHEILEGYGLTEAAPVISINHPSDNRIGTIGPPIPGVEVEIRDEEGNALPQGEIGELCSSGDNTMLGYYKNTEFTQEAMHNDGWLRTGDMARFDEHGCLQIMGRYKDLIVSAGENIYPREIEETLLRVPGVMEAAVVAKPNKLRSEVPFAFVVVVEEAKDKIDAKVLRQHCLQHLADYKIPDGFSVIEQMPKTATGKIRKEILKAEYL